MPKLTTYVEYLHPGSFVAETSGKEVPNRNPQREAAEAPESAYGFRYYDRFSDTAKLDGAEVELTSKSLRRSKIYYIGGEVLTVADVERMDQEAKVNGKDGWEQSRHEILLSNMRGNRWDQVLRARTGNIVEFDPKVQEIVRF
jgi:hypothetical protein